MSGSRRGPTTRAGSRPCLTAELLDAPVRHTARVVARAFLEVVIAERTRLPDGSDALHDFRVALRRLRSWLRACWPWLRDVVHDRTRRAFAEIAGASNAARDAEVGLLWLDAQRGLPARSRADVLRLVRRLRRDLGGATHRFNAKLEREFGPAVHGLERALLQPIEAMSLEGRKASRTSTAYVAMIRADAADLLAALYRVRTVDDDGFAHRARIAGKRLRYLLEPLTGDENARGAVRRLTRLQDALGEFHDACVLGARVGRARPALARRAQERTARAFARVRRGWLGGKTNELLAAIELVGDGVSRRSSI